MNKQYKIVGLNFDPDSLTVAVQLQAVDGGDTVTFRFDSVNPIVAQLTIGRTVNAVFTFA